MNWKKNELYGFNLSHETIRTTRKMNWFVIHFSGLCLRMGIYLLLPSDTCPSPSHGPYRVPTWLCHWHYSIFLLHQDCHHYPERQWSLPPFIELPSLPLHMRPPISWTAGAETEAAGLVPWASPSVEQNKALRGGEYFVFCFALAKRGP